MKKTHAKSGLRLTDWLNSVNQTKQDLMIDSQGNIVSEVERSFPSFVVVRSMMYFPDTLFYGNEINQYGNLDNVMVYDYLRHSVRRRKRFSKWVKRETDDITQRIIDVYGVNRKKALVTKKILEQDNDSLREFMEMTTLET